MSIGRPKHSRAPSVIRGWARQLRLDQTPAERKLWRALRARLPIDGSHFRRQVCLGPFIVDFCSLGARLIVELDGNQHGEDDARRRDAARDRFLRDRAFRVLRFSNRDVMTDLEVVLDTISSALAERSAGSDELPPP